MMARLLTEEASAPSNTPPEGMCEASKPQNVSSRKLSFKTRQAALRGTYRATKVSLSSSNVALIASKFNTIVINDEVQGRALLRKLSSNQRKPSNSKDIKTRAVRTSGDGVVKAAIQLFEPNNEFVKNGKPLLRKDIRPKLVVVRKSSSKSSAKTEDTQKSEIMRDEGRFPKDSAKENNHLISTDLTVVKEVKRKPSLKAKPVLRQVVVKNHSSANSLNHNVKKFNSVDGSRNSSELTYSIQEVRVPAFNLNDRIAQFSQNNNETKFIEDKANQPNKSSSKVRVISHLEEKENKPEVVKSILRSSKSKQSNLVAQTKDRLEAIIEQNNITNKDKNLILRPDKMKENEDKEQKGFERLTNIIDKDENSLVASSKAYSSIENILDEKHSQNLEPLNRGSHNNTKNFMYAELSFPNGNNGDTNGEKVIEQQNQLLNNTNTQTNSTTATIFNKTSPPLSKDSCLTLKPSIKPYSSESPKLEKKNLCLTTDPSESLLLDNIKPNNSFLWKPSSKLSVVTEVPIYDDRPESINSVGENTRIESVCNKICDKDNELKTANPLNLDVASSFILEMTEQIERRFSSGSVQEVGLECLEETDFKSVIEEKNNSVVQDNSSFLHGTHCTKELPSTKVLPQVIEKQKLARSSKVAPPVYKKPICRTGLEDSPPQLPEKKQKTLSCEMDKSLTDIPPPIPPSCTKPKLKLTLSEEAWLSNCKKILEIPPPLRSRNKEESSTDLETHFESTTKSLPRRLPGINESIGEKRFSVSQVDLLKRMSEMNVGNKRNSLPADATSLSHSYTDAEDEEDHYSSIAPFERIEEDQNTYEAIGENSYAEIQEYEERTAVDEDGEGEGSNIYDDVIGQEDHYEAINCALVQGDSDSSCDQSNSLYGVARPPSTALPGGTYQVAGGSDTSDEWVDLPSDDQNESVYIFREKERGRGLVPTESWSMKVRRQWSRKAADADDGSDGSVPRSYENIENSEETLCDDFDDSCSDSSFEHEAINPHVQAVVEEKKVQPISEGIYGFMKQASHHVRKHWPLGKNLTRMRKNKSTNSIPVPLPAVTTSNLGRRGWSFKSKDKPLSAQSTFYLYSTNTLSRTEKKPEPKVDPRRLSTASMVARPTSPPPPPPPRISLDETNKRKSDLNSSNNSTHSSGDNEGYIEGQRRLSRNGNSMWYIDTSTDSASEHGSSHGSDLNLRFADEPLYQFYAANIAEMTLSQLSEADGDGYEEITPSQSALPPLPSALELVSSMHHRTLWCDLPQVRNSGVLDTLSQSQKRLQEAKFEVMTSEASYFKSLSVLDKLFASCPLFSDENILSRDERKVLFGNVSTVRKCSEKLLAALQKCWQECILLQGICDVIYEHVKTYREVYVKFCTNQISMDRTLKTLKAGNTNFSTVLAQLEADPECQSLTLYSFLMLPMQRITRLRLLIETMLSLLEPADSEHSSCQKALDTLNRCVAECNEGARSQERLEEMVRLSKQLEFPPEVVIPILDQGRNRWLVRSGQVTHVNMDAKHTFGRRLSRTGPKFTIFLFTDLLLLAKKKSEESYLIVDHCQRSLVETQEIKDFPGNNRFLLQLTLLENSESKTVEMTLSCENETDRQRWLQVLTPPQSQDPGETLYEDWDCPQVTAVHSYQPCQPDELPLALGDILNVLRKSEGWFYGERTRDGEKGWFPGNYTREIASKHTRARNLKQRHRLLQLSADFVQQQRRVKS